MTYAAVPALRAQPEIAAEWEPLLIARGYDPRAAPGAREGRGQCGMAMTEKQGGSDVRANTTRAPMNGGGDGAESHHRPQVVLLGADVRRSSSSSPRPTRASPASLCRASCPTARATRFHLQRLKDKLGNRSNASQRGRVRTAPGRSCVGEPGRGVPTIIEMVNHTRLDCVIGSAAGMRVGGRAGRPSTPRTAARSASC